MAIQRVLAIIGGIYREYVAKDVSAGSGDAGNLVALNSAGKVDSTMMPTGVGATTASLPATEAISAGAYVNVWSSAGTPSVRNADGSTSGKEADGFVLAGVSNGATATVYFAGVNTAVTGQTAGLVYLSATTPGAGTASGAATAGQTYQQLGVAISATSVDFAPQYPIVRT